MVHTLLPLLRMTITSDTKEVDAMELAERVSTQSDLAFDRRAVICVAQ